jgi:hypothetical protein
MKPLPDEADSEVRKHLEWVKTRMSPTERVYCAASAVDTGNRSRWTCRCPRRPFSDDEIKVIRMYYQAGDSIESLADITRRDEEVLREITKSDVGR